MRGIGVVKAVLLVNFGVWSTGTLRRLISARRACSPYGAKYSYWDIMLNKTSTNKNRRDGRVGYGARLRFNLT